ncbi:MAG: hypothetical protein GY941_16755, partial [Planctomycetes bacterium]|nr:hypothetical protein [Planctomycetota bacterium]
YAFTGREWDEKAGLYYYRARYYDANTGRFIQGDPIGFAGGDVNFYVYVQNNPVNFIDPVGEFAWVAAGAGIGAIINISATIIANGGDVSAQQIIAAGVSGAISGAIGSVAGPLGGSVARVIGQRATSLIGLGAQSLFSAGGGYAGQLAANKIDPCHGTNPLNAAMFAGIGGPLANKLFPVTGMSTLRQSRFFAPSTASGIYRSNLSSAIGTSSGVGAASNFFNGPF